MNAHIIPPTFPLDFLTNPEWLADLSEKVCDEVNSDELLQLRSCSKSYDERAKQIIFSRSDYRSLRIRKELVTTWVINEDKIEIPEQELMCPDYDICTRLLAYVLFARMRGVPLSASPTEYLAGFLRSNDRVSALASLLSPAYANILVSRKVTNYDYFYSDILFGILIRKLSTDQLVALLPYTLDKINSPWISNVSHGLWVFAFVARVLPEALTRTHVQQVLTKLDYNNGMDQYSALEVVSVLGGSLSTDFFASLPDLMKRRFLRPILLNKLPTIKLLPYLPSIIAGLNQGDTSARIIACDEFIWLIQKLPDEYVFPHVPSVIAVVRQLYRYQVGHAFVRLVRRCSPMLDPLLYPLLPLALDEVLRGESLVLADLKLVGRFMAANLTAGECKDYLTKLAQQFCGAHAVGELSDELQQYYLSVVMAKFSSLYVPGALLTFNKFSSLFSMKVLLPFLPTLVDILNNHSKNHELYQKAVECFVSVVERLSLELMRPYVPMLRNISATIASVYDLSEYAHINFRIFKMLMIMLPAEELRPILSEYLQLTDGLKRFKDSAIDLLGYLLATGKLQMCDMAALSKLYPTEYLLLEQIAICRAQFSQAGQQRAMSVSVSRFRNHAFFKTDAPATPASSVPARLDGLGV